MNCGTCIWWIVIKKSLVFKTSDSGVHSCYKDKLKKKAEYKNIYLTWIPFCKTNEQKYKYAYKK